MHHEGQDQTSRGTLPSLIQTGEGFLLKFELGLSLSWLTLPRLVLGSACALVFSLVLVLAWLVLGFASASSVFVFVGRRRAPHDLLVRAPETSPRNLRSPRATHEQLGKEGGRHHKRCNMRAKIKLQEELSPV